MRDKLFKPMILPRAQTQLHADRGAHLQRALDARLEVAADRAGVVAEEAENVDADDLAAVGFRGVQHVDDAGGVEGNGESFEVDDEELCCVEGRKQSVLELERGEREGWIWICGEEMKEMEVQCAKGEREGQKDCDMTCTYLGVRGIKGVHLFPKVHLLDAVQQDVLHPGRLGRILPCRVAVHGIAKRFQPAVAAAQGGIARSRQGSWVVAAVFVDVLRRRQDAQDVGAAVDRCRAVDLAAEEEGDGAVGVEEGGYYIVGGLVGGMEGRVVRNGGRSFEG